MSDELYWPLAPVDGLDVDDYEIVEDTAQRTVIDLPLAAATPDGVKFVAFAPSEMYFRQKTEAGDQYTGDLIFHLRVPQIKSPLAIGAFWLELLWRQVLYSFLVIEDVTIRRASWLEFLGPKLNLKKGRVKTAAGVTFTYAANEKVQEKFDLLRTGGLSVSFEPGESVVAAVPTVDEKLRCKFFLGAITGASPRLVGQTEVGPSPLTTILTDLRGVPANRFSSHLFVTAIPLAYFFLGARCVYIGASARRHALWAQLLGLPEDLEIPNAETRVRDLLDPDDEAWRAFFLSSEYRPRGLPLPWGGWAGHVLDVDGEKCPVGTAGLAFAKCDGDEDVDLELASPAGAAVGLRSHLQRVWNNTITVDIAQRYEIPVLANLGEPTFAHRLKPGTDWITATSAESIAPAQYADKARFAVRMMFGGQPAAAMVHSIIVRRDETRWYEDLVCKQTDDATRFGVVRTGVTPEGAVARDREYFINDLGWHASQIDVMQACSSNEGGFDSINTWDRAFLSWGILNWTIWTGGNHAGELPAFLAFLANRNPDLFHEFFGRYELGTTPPTAVLYRGGGDEKDTLPRCLLTLPSSGGGSRIEFGDNEDRRTEFRSYLWVARFIAAGMDYVVQRLQLEFGRERMKNARDIPLVFAGAPHTVGSLFRSKLATALIYDQYINKPSRVRPALQECLDMGGYQPNPGDTLSTENLAIFLPRYHAKRALTKTNSQGKEVPVNMNDGPSRGARIEAAGLSNEAGSFTWPPGDFNAWFVEAGATP